MKHLVRVRTVKSIAMGLALVVFVAMINQSMQKIAVEQSAAQLHHSSEAIVKNWHALQTAFPDNQHLKESLEMVLIKDGYMLLDLLVLGASAVREQYIADINAMGIQAMDGLFRNDEGDYTVGGFKLSGFDLTPDGNPAVFYSGVHLSVIQRLNEQVDKQSDISGALTFLDRDGRVKYAKDADSPIAQYELGIYL